MARQPSLSPQIPPCLSASLSPSGRQNQTSRMLIFAPMSEAESKKKVRSPSFPFIGLREALDRARAFYEAEQRNAARPETAAAHWGYSPKSSGGKQTIAALRAFGLLDGDSLVKLSGRALRIVLDERSGSEERERLLQQAALMPPIHARLWERYGAELPLGADAAALADPGRGVQRELGGRLPDRVPGDAGVCPAAADRPGARGAEGRAAGRRAGYPHRRDRRRRRGSIRWSFRCSTATRSSCGIRRKISSLEAEDLRTVFELWLRKIVER